MLRKACRRSGHHVVSFRDSRNHEEWVQEVWGSSPVARLSCLSCVGENRVKPIVGVQDIL